MNIFISWSKQESKEIAIELQKLFTKLNNSAKVFVSENSIEMGSEFQKEILDAIRKADLFVVIYTRTSKKSPWVSFEGGFACGLNKKVVPMLFYDDKNWHSWIDNPLNSFTAVRYNTHDFDKNICDMLKIDFDDANKKIIKRSSKNIKKIQSKYYPLDEECLDFLDYLLLNKSIVSENPKYFTDSGTKVALFNHAFETSDLHKVYVDYFTKQNGKYLWIFGRKNERLIIGYGDELINYLKSKIQPGSTTSLDVRWLFLDPKYEGVDKAHQNPERLKIELNSTLDRVDELIGDNDALRSCFKFYNCERREIIVRIDNVILLATPSFDKDGKPQLVTDMPFEVFSANSEKGKKYIEKFEDVWKNHTKPFEIKTK